MDKVPKSWPLGPTEARVWSPALRCKLVTVLFMDNGTRVSKTLPGLKQLIEAFCNFCHKFRSQLNPKKSKVMHITRHGHDEEVQVKVGDHIFTTPEPGAKDRVLHEYLGFLTLANGLDRSSNDWPQSHPTVSQTV